MSIPSKVVFASACTFSVGIIGYVHYKQYSDREQMHAGVVRDMESRQRRKTENLYTLQKQSDLTKELKKQQIEDGIR